MSKILKVFVRDGDGPFERIDTAGNVNTYLNDGDVYEVILYPCKTSGSRVFRHGQIALLRDLDLSKHIPPEVQCVVCKQAVPPSGDVEYPDSIIHELYEGDIIKMPRLNPLTKIWDRKSWVLGVVKYDAVFRHQFVASDYPEDHPPDYKPTPIHHFIDHKKGEIIFWKSQKHLGHILCDRIKNGRIEKR